MSVSFKARLGASAIALGAAASGVQAATQTVEFSTLVGSATLNSAVAVGDTFILDSVITGATGALSQTIEFTLGAGVTGVSGIANWLVGTSTLPNLSGVNIDVFNASTSALVASDTFAGVLGGTAVSTLTGSLGAGTYRLVATGNGVRDSVLNVAVTAVPEPGTYAMLLAGLALIGVHTMRRQRRD
jgi:hypothetical protein